MADDHEFETKFKAAKNSSERADLIDEFAERDYPATVAAAMGNTVRVTRCTELLERQVAFAMSLYDIGRVEQVKGHSMLVKRLRSIERVTRATGMGIKSLGN